MVSDSTVISPGGLSFSRAMGIYTARTHLLFEAKYMCTKSSVGGNEECIVN